VISQAHGLKAWWVPLSHIRCMCVMMCVCTCCVCTYVGMSVICRHAPNIIPWKQTTGAYIRIYIQPPPHWIGLGSA